MHPVYCTHMYYCSAGIALKGQGILISVTNCHEADYGLSRTNASILVSGCNAQVPNLTPLNFSHALNFA